ncbi:ABC transporter ATP-binding protein [Egicoccus halophilus]|uniref:ABC-type quaternary amine transporter n=1 Tax=Egicoccus halophilus TaxID=1670830 RepID=A0A8J3A6D8_9ACTN|nr:ABC transporter ATP-binding protein [Egicoccus halophilus]GGI04409.1 ABC transporter ATP-binding protein [Egicoccus halophilus]
MTDAMIRLDELTKRYPGTEAPAVDRLSLAIPRGEIVVFVGPSGCGKTTSLKMINRIIEPSAGRILLDGEDVTRSNPNELRRRMGYVIQQVGLFPHQTIADNVATVPGLLGWERDRIRARVDELLSVVGLDPEQYRDRYPKELSGGQRQRVGVARALAADPPVLLMDEPFGAIDPITRTRLQNEFLRLQAELQKTIVFVTHDIDEAIKMGDRIAILREHSHVAQFATPEEILTAPADDFVEDFVGSGATLKRLKLSRVRDVPWLTDGPIGTVDEDEATLRSRLGASDWTALLLLDEHRRPLRWLRAPDFRHQRPVRELGLPARAMVEPQATLSDALEEMLLGSAGVAIVVDGSGAYQGIVDVDALVTSMQAVRDANIDYYRAAKLVDPADMVAG